VKVGGLFEGYGGLTTAAQAVLGGDLAWYSEIDPAASRVLAHHHPDVPNLGDITRVDWSTVEPVDVLAGGFPCQDISNAGRREGITGERSGLWSHFAAAIGALRPRYVLIENVAALAVRGLDVVLADLAALRFDAEWTTVRASSVGAPHRRERLFIAAVNTASAGPQGSPGGRIQPGEPMPGRVATADTHGQGSQGAEPARGRDVPTRRPATDAEGDGRNEGQPEPTRIGRRPDVAVRAAPARVEFLPLELHQEPEHVEWGKYAPAIERWAAILGRPAPVPLARRYRGGRFLNPAFAEWMMGLPLGRITAVPGLTRSDQLKLAGNGVVPQQAAAALAHLLPLLAEQEVAA
jgi:DNA (cytosine-5)-methyltransferase 1